MNKFRGLQQDKILQFVSFTSAPENIAIHFLQTYNWKLETAVDAYYRSPDRLTQGANDYEPTNQDSKKKSSSMGKEKGSQTDVKKIEALFEHYAEYENPSKNSTTLDAIQVLGIEKFCQDLQLDPSDLLILIIAWKMKAKTMCVFTREEFIKGFLSMGCDSIQKLQSKFISLKTEIFQESSFRDLYMFSFHFGLEPGQKSLSLDVAIALWKILLKVSLFLLCLFRRVY
eukprot:Sdes_comp16034_c0_seq3m5234